MNEGYFSMEVLFVRKLDFYWKTNNEWYHK